MVFERLERRIIMQGEIEALTPLHIGSGKPQFEGDIDLPILKDSRGPYIPGSSLKGKVRSETERIARSTGLRVCNPPAIEEMCGSRASKEEDLCIACSMFGTASMRGGISRASKIKFRDAYATTSIQELTQRTGIALDRSVGSVKGGALYTIEAVPTGTKFGLEIVAENLTDQELNLLRAALKSVEDNALGGHSSRGFGKIKFNITGTKVRTAKFYTGEEPEKTI